MIGVRGRIIGANCPAGSRQLEHRHYTVEFDAAEAAIMGLTAELASETTRRADWIRTHDASSCGFINLFDCKRLASTRLTPLSQKRAGGGWRFK